MHGGIPVINPMRINDWIYDEIFIIVENITFAEEIKNELQDFGIPKEKIINLPFSKEYMDVYMNQRSLWIQDYAKWVYENGISGNVAECGVYRGDSAKFINKFFFDRKLYLFDTFEGFPEQDIAYEFSLDNEGFNNGRFARQITLRDTDIKYILEKMPYLELVEIKKGYFPESAKEIKDTFCFVNLDMDLYLPMLNGLRFFWGCLEKGGCILLHDYFNYELPGVRQAVVEFERERNISIPKTPIGDECSIALIKNI